MLLMGKPKPSVPKSCKNLKNNDYFQWLVSNIGSWTRVDRSIVMSALIAWKKKADHSMSNGDLLSSINDCVCGYASTPAEKSACDCQKTTNEIAKFMAREEERVQANAVNAAKNKSSKDNYAAALVKYNAALEGEKARLIGATCTTNCNKRCGSNAGDGNSCRADGHTDSDWEKLQSVYTCDKVRHTKRELCKLSQRAINSKLGIWKSKNKPPNPVNRIEHVQGAPATFELACCSQNFNNVGVNSNFKMSDIHQTCGNKVLKASSEAPKDSSKTPEPEPDGSGYQIGMAMSSVSSSSFLIAAAVIAFVL